MRYLSYQIIFFLFTISIFAQSPHGDSFNLDCSECHSADSWKIDLTKIFFDHSKTNFALVGQHINLDCKSCHQSLVFSKMDKDCFSCHKDIHQGTVGLDCANCHTPATWVVKDIIGLHQKGRFPLLGAHQTADCAQCHSGYPELKFDPLNIDCYSCHKQNYESAQIPNHIAANFSTECQDCHNISALSWNTTNIDHSFFPLVGGHALPNCYSCHQQGGNFSGLSSECYSCHQQTYEATQNPNHISAGLPTTCDVCHSIYGWAPAQFNHDLTAFPLTGKHINTDCSNCHASGYTGTPTDCYSCHQQDYQGTTDPNHVASQFPTDCNLCHTTSGWDNANFDHNTSQFPLTGAHVQTACASCHTSGYTGTPTDCYSCHQQDYQITTDPNHVASQFPTDCNLCHTTSGWDGANFDHNASQFPLTGAHIQTACASCHTSGYTGTPTECYSCHQQDYQSTTDPNHVLENYPQDCSVCHSTNNWDDANFDHNTSQFPLTGAHVQTACVNCHTNGYTGTPTDCYACHQTNYNNTTNPNHQAAGFLTSCADCHSTTAWQPATFDHDNQYFPIYSGKHAGKWTQCSECHTVPNNYSSFSCIDCHDHNRTDTDNQHQAVQGYVYNSEDCFSCHPQGSSDGAFNHATSSFPLIGLHLTTSCADCHQSGYSGTSSVCADCHLTEYNSAANPNHQTLSISTDCGTCHTPTADWKPALYPEHNQVYQLIGRHLEIANDCESCHNGNYTTTENQCVGCHQNAYNASVNPNHTAAGISTECSTCHNTNGWTPSTFDHSSTGFTLLGAHQPLQCSGCHNGTTTGLTSDCQPCHQTDYNSAANHTAQSYPINCEMCHNSVNWNQTTFNHQNTSFPLTGAHITSTCQSCHQSGFTNTPTDCYACHTTDYNNTTNPNHTSASFPTTCVDCHSTSAWQPATFDHDNQYFPIYSGSHNGKWNQCSECHTTANNYSLFSCIDCHEHNRTDMDSKHQDVNNYVYNSLNCYDCHPDGRHRPVFNHTMTDFPLTGAHVQVECAQCHTTNQNRLSTECVACHMQDYLKAVNPNHQATGISTDCISCHSTSNWSSGIKLFEDNKTF